MPKILLHTCCGPCSTAIISYLQKHGFTVTGFFYNPNIQPASEHKIRLASLREYFRKHKLELIVSETKPGYDEAFMTTIKDKKLKPARCQACYELRIKTTAKQAQDRGFQAFTTTLLGSPHQDIEVIKSLGKKYARMYDVKFFTPSYGQKKYKGFRPLFTECRHQAKQAGLYHQEYCGCLFSRRERFAKPSE